MYTKPKIKVICKKCKKVFYILPGNLRQRPNISFCSKKCDSGKRLGKWKTLNCTICHKSFECLKSRVNRKCCGIICSRKFAGKIRKKNGFWYENGYKILYTGKKNGIKEHRAVMEKHLGRKLENWELVHHKNGNKLDNRPENLQVMTYYEHSKLHRELDKKNGKKLFTKLVKGRSNKIINK